MRTSQRLAGCGLVSCTAVDCGGAAQPTPPPLTPHPPAVVVRPAVPDKDKLASFVQAVRTLDVGVVKGLLDERMSLGLPANDTTGTGASIAQKALAVVDAIASAPGCEAVAKHLSDHCDVVLELADTAEKPALKAAAIKTLHALGLHDAAASFAPPAAASAPGTVAASAPVAGALPAAAPAPAPAPPAAPDNDLLGIGPASAAPAPAAGMGSLFGALTISGAVASPAPAPAPSPASAPLFAGLATAAPAPAPAPALPSSFPMFGGLTVAAPSPAPAPMPAAVPLFGGLSTSAPAPAPGPVPSPASGPAASAGSALASSILHAYTPGAAAAPTLAAAPAASMPGFTPAGTFPHGTHVGILQQQLATVQSQLSSLMTLLTTPGLDPAIATAQMPQLVALQTQQQQLMTALTSAMAASASGGGVGFAPPLTSATPAAPPAAGTFVMAPAPAGSGIGASTGGSMALNGGSVLRGGVPAAPAPAPAPAAKPADAFDFVMGEFR